MRPSTAWMMPALLATLALAGCAEQEATDGDDRTPTTMTPTLSPVTNDTGRGNDTMMANESSIMLADQSERGNATDDNETTIGNDTNATSSASP